MQVLASLNRMLESKERREQTRMSNALAMMQYAQTKKMQDYQLAATKIEYLKQANLSMQKKSAEAFAADTGLLNFNLEEDTGMEAAMKFAESRIKYKKDGRNTGGLGLDEGEAHRLVGAIFRHSKGESGALLNIALEVSDLADVESLARSKGQKSPLRGSEKKLYKAFEEGLGYFHDIERARSTLLSVKQSMSNADAIVKEEFELAKGDLTISKEIRGFSQETLATAAEDMDVLAKPVGSPQEELAKAKSHTIELQQSLSDYQNSITTMEEELVSLEMLEDSGKLTDEQKQYKSSIPAIRKNLEKEMMDLSNQIDQTASLEKMLEDYEDEKDEGSSWLPNLFHGPATDDDDDADDASWLPNLFHGPAAP